MSEETHNQESDEMDGAMTEMTQPIIIDLGRQKSKKLKALKKGEGPLWEEIFEVVEEVKDLLGEEAEGKLMVPIVMIYEKKAKRSQIERLMFPLSK